MNQLENILINNKEYFINNYRLYLNDLIYNEDNYKLLFEYKIKLISIEEFLGMYEDHKDLELKFIKNHLGILNSNDNYMNEYNNKDDKTKQQIYDNVEEAKNVLNNHMNRYNNYTFLWY
jgi:hypothetical protein